MSDDEDNILEDAEDAKQIHLHRRTTKKKRHETSNERGETSPALNRDHHQRNNITQMTMNDYGEPTYLKQQTMEFPVSQSLAIEGGFNYK